MALQLKLSTVLVTMLVLGTLAPVEVTEAANPFSLRNLKNFMKSVIQLASSSSSPHHHDNRGESQDHSRHHPAEHHHKHRVMPTTDATTPPLVKRLPQLSREELEDLLEAQLQEIQSRNDTNTNETIDIDDLASNYTEGYDAENSTAGYNDTVGYNTTTATEPPEEEKSGSKSGTFSKGSKTAPFRAHEEGIGAGRSRPCPHFLDFSCSEPLKKLKKLYQKLYATTERPTTMLEEGSEPATTEPSEIEPASTEPSGTTEPEPASTMEPNSEPTVTSRLQGTMLSYMYAQVRRPEHNMVQVQTPHTRTTVVYIPLNRNEALHIAATEACIFATNNMDIKPCRFEDLYSYKEDCVEEQSRRIAVCDTVYANKVCYFAMENNVCLE